MEKRKEKSIADGGFIFLILLASTYLTFIVDVYTLNSWPKRIFVFLYFCVMGTVVTWLKARFVGLSSRKTILASLLLAALLLFTFQGTFIPDWESHQVILRANVSEEYPTGEVWLTGVETDGEFHEASSLNDVSINNWVNNSESDDYVFYPGEAPLENSLCFYTPAKDFTLCFASNPWSGSVMIEENGKTEMLTLYAEEENSEPLRYELKETVERPIAEKLLLGIGASVVLTFLLSIVLAKAILKSEDHTRLLTVEELLFCIYLIAILLSQAVLSIDSERQFVFVAGLIVLISFFIGPKLLKVSAETRINHENGPITRKRRLSYLVIPLAVFLLHYAAFYPGAFSPDSFAQYAQAISGAYDDWHPFVHTILVVKFPLVLTNGWIGSIVLFQILLFSFALQYALLTVHRYTSQRFAAFSMLLILLNPQTGCIAMYPWKDVSFAIGTLILVSFCIHIVMSQGKWLDSFGHMIVFVLAIVVTTLVRHNALLFTVPLLIAVVIFCCSKRTVFAVMAVFLLIACIKGPVFSVANVEKPGQRQVEVLGLPMSVIGAVVKEHPEDLDEETKKFVYSVAPREVWDKEYTYDGYNSIKWNERTNNDIIEQYGVARVMNIMFRCMKTDLRSALHGFVAVSDPVYSITDLHDPYCYPAIAENNYGIVQRGNSVLRFLITKYGLIRQKIPHVFGCLGIIHLLLMTVIMSKCRLNKLSSWKTILFIIPVFCYNFGTMMLMTYSNDAARFFYYTFLIFPFLLVFFLGKQRSQAQETNGFEC